MNIEERDRKIAARIKEARGMTEDHAGLSLLVEHCAKRIGDSQKTIAEWAKRAAEEPADAIQWSHGAIAANWDLLFYMQTLNIVCDASDDASRFARLKLKHEDLRIALIEGRYEDKSTSATSRAVGESNTVAARNALRSMNELMREVEKQGW